MTTTFKFLELPEELRHVVLNHRTLSNCDQLCAALACRDFNRLVQLRRIVLHQTFVNQYPNIMKMELGDSPWATLVQAMRSAHRRGRPCEELDAFIIRKYAHHNYRGVPLDVMFRVASTHPELVAQLQRVVVNAPSFWDGGVSVHVADVVNSLPRMRTLEFVDDVLLENTDPKNLVYADPRVRYARVVVCNRDPNEHPTFADVDLGQTVGARQLDFLTIDGFFSATMAVRLERARDAGLRFKGLCVEWSGIEPGSTPLAAEGCSRALADMLMPGGHLELFDRKRSTSPFPAAIFHALVQKGKGEGGALSTLTMNSRCSTSLLPAVNSSRVPVAALHVSGERANTSNEAEAAALALKGMLTRGLVELSLCHFDMGRHPALFDEAHGLCKLALEGEPLASVLGLLSREEAPLPSLKQLNVTPFFENGTIDLCEMTIVEGIAKRRNIQFHWSL